MNFFELFFPKYCISCKKIGEYICSSCFSSISFTQGYMCAMCGNAALNGKTHPGCKTKYSIDGVISCVEYKNVIKKVIYTLKYKPYAFNIVHAVGDLMYEMLIQDELWHQINTEKTVFVPIPLYKSRLRTRGYNQSLLVAQELGKRFKLSTQDLLMRKRNTVRQASLPKKDRYINVKGAFSIASPVRNITSVILVDDVVTTGATLVEAVNVLKRNGVQKVWGVTFARD